MWIKRTGVGGTAAAWLAQIYTGSAVNIAIQTNGVSALSDQVGGGYFNGGWVTGNPITMPLSNWVYVTYTYDGIRIRSYSNAVFIGSVNGSGAASDQGTQYRIGRRWDNADYVVGELGQVLVYNRALTGAEILQNYRATSNVYTV
jgi:hypothetical protein